MAANTNFPVLNASKVATVWGSPVQALAEEGVLYVATNPTPGTAIATTTSVVDAGNAGATSAQTRPVAIIYNANQPASLVNLFPLTFNMILSQVPTSGTSWQMAMWLEPVGASAYTSGGSQITPVAANQAISTTSRAQIYFGAITAAATTTGGRLISRRQINPVIPVTLDQWFFSFGKMFSGDQIAAGAGAKNVMIALPAVVIPPLWALKIGMWGAANAAAPSWEFELQYAERPAGQ